MNELTELKNVTTQIGTESALLLYFYNDDCPPCISLRPKIEQLVKTEFERMKLVWVNAKKHPEIPAHYGVFANPAILVFFEGKEFRRYSKYISVEEMKSSIKRVYDLLFN